MATEIKRLKILSTHRFSSGESDEEINTTDTVCELLSRGDSLLVRYSEGEGDERVCVRIHYSPERLTVKRDGAANSCLEFLLGERIVGVYDAGGFLFDTEVYTKRLEVHREGGAVEITLLYDMKIGEVERSTDMRISVS